MRLKYKILLAIITVGIGICLMTYQSYALWVATYTGGENIVNVGCFEIEFTEQTSSIGLNNTYPVSDTKGLTTNPYTFTIKNTCTVGASYDVTLNTLTTNTMKKEWLKYAIQKSDEAKPTTGINLGTNNNYNTTTEELQIPNLDESIIIASGELKQEESVTYNLYLWMDETTGNEAMNTTFEGSINIISSAINKIPNAAEYITLLANTSSEIVNDETADQNLRYIGANPNNYVYFNCQDYNNPTSDTCELWRIIGVMNNMELADGTTGQSLVKLVRKESIGSFSWDNKPTGVGSSLSNNGSNNWTDARLMMLLNPGYETPNSPIYEYEGSLYYNAKSGTCYSGENNGTVSCDFTNTGLQNDTTRNMIEEVVWHLGGSNTHDDVTANLFYIREKESTVFDGITTSWTGKISLLYPSDYGYATNGGNVTNRTTCLTNPLYYWNDANYVSNDCYSNNWLYDASNNFWTLHARSNNSYDVFVIGYIGYVSYNIVTINRYSVLPTLFLSSDVRIINGDGSSSSPFILSI